MRSSDALSLIRLRKGLADPQPIAVRMQPGMTLGVKPDEAHCGFVSEKPRQLLAFCQSGDRRIPV